MAFPDEKFQLIWWWTTDFEPQFCEMLLLPPQKKKNIFLINTPALQKLKTTIVVYIFNLSKKIAGNAFCYYTSTYIISPVLPISLQNLTHLLSGSLQKNSWPFPVLKNLTCDFSSQQLVTMNYKLFADEHTHFEKNVRVSQNTS